MEKMEIRLYCSLCDEHVDAVALYPDGWTGQYMEIDHEGMLCPKHANIMPFIRGQCDNCVSGWGDSSCPLYRNYAFAKMNITPEEMAVIRAGKCPYRVCGSFSLGPEGFTTLDDASGAEVAGNALADAIEEYVANG